MKKPEEIMHLFIMLKEARTPGFERMEKVRRLSNGDMPIPLPELTANEKSGIVNLLVLGIDQMGMRIASVMPDISYPPMRPGITLSEDKARNRRLANLAWWDMNQMGIILRQRARYLLAYGTSPVTLSPVSLKPTDKREMPFWRSRNPFSAYLPDPDTENDMEPIYGIFAHSQSRQWLEARYPDAMRRLSKGRTGPMDKFEVLEYHDATEITMIVLGRDPEGERTQRDSYGRESSVPMGSACEMLSQTENRAEIPLIVSPGRITLDRIVGYFDQIPDMHFKQAKMDALETISMTRSIFPEEWAITHPSSPMQVEIVQEATAKRGIRGEIKGGQIQQLTPSPNVQVAPAIDRLERNQRVTAGIPAEFGGESPTNIRTARRGSEVMSSTVTMPIGEAQDIFAASLEAEDVRGIALMKGWHGSKQYSFYQSRSGKSTSTEDYSVKDDFETDMHFVKYAMPGTDASAIPIEIGQRIGTTEMSLQTAREMDPVIEDPIRERDQVEVEGLRKAMLTGMEQQAAQGQLGAPTIAAIVKLKLGKTHPNLEDAVLAFHDSKQKTQAQQVGGTPQQQPGMAPPPGGPTAAGPQGPGGAIPPPNPNQANLSQVLQTLRRPTNQSGAERSLTS